MKTTIKKGFTLVELLFVMAIIAILAGFAIANLKDSTKVATENSLKNDAKNFIAQQQTYFAANQEYLTNCGNPDGQGMATCSADTSGLPSVKIPVSKGNTITTMATDTCDGSQGFSVQFTNTSINKSVSYDSCTDGRLGNVVNAGA